MPRRFCCRLTPSGIGDLVSQLNRLHDLGVRAGLEYVYREFPRNRWSPDFDAADFLGLGLGEQRLEDLPGARLVSVDGADAARALAEGRPIESLLPRGTPPDAIVELVHSDALYTHGAAVELRHPLDLRGKLVRRHGAEILTRRRPGEISVCVHVRQGDCTWVRRGDRYVFLGMRKIATDPSDVDLRRAPGPDAYAPILAEVAARLAGRAWSLAVYSDGPMNLFAQPAGPMGRTLFALSLREPRLVNWLRLARPRHPLHALYNPMSDDEVVAAWEQASGALQRLVAPYPGAQLVVGSDRALTEQAIVAFATADVVVLPRSRMAFPLLGLGAVEQQAVLLVSKSLDENRATLDAQLPAATGA